MSKRIGTPTETGIARFFQNHGEPPSHIARILARVEVDEDSECWMFTGAKTTQPDGYGVIGIGSRTDGSKSIARTHRLMYEWAKGPIPVGLLVCHACDRRPCCNPDHLFLGTHSDNSRDMWSKGRQGDPACKGEANGRAKLTEADVRRIRELSEAGVSRAELARQYGMGTTVISAIARRQMWRHVA